MRSYFPGTSGKESVIHNAAPPELFRAGDNSARAGFRSEFGINEGEILLGAIGNLNWVKGIGYLLESLAGIREKCYKVILIGSRYDDEMARMRKFLAEKGLADKVIFAGFRKDISAALDGMDIFVHPSVEEADPWVVTEAMARAKPVIATGVGGIPEKMIDGETGLLVPPADPTALARAITRALGDAAARETWGRAARKRMSEIFPVGKMISEYEKAYRPRER
jgi:glycosyltransferase involved in cell wall biosynthesis